MTLSPHLLLCFFLLVFSYSAVMLCTVMFLVDQEALKASHSSASEKVSKTRQTTLNDFNIDLDTMTSLDGGTHDVTAVPSARRVSQCK
jgi:hypothetical protein